MIHDEIIVQDGTTVAVIGAVAHRLYFAQCREFGALFWDNNPNYPPGAYLLDVKGHNIGEVGDYREGDIVLTVKEVTNAR